MLQELLHPTFERDGNMWNPFRKPQPILEDIPPGELSTPIDPAPPTLVVPAAVILKKLKWVVVDEESVGIVTDFDTSGMCTIDLVDSEGLTTTTVRVSPGNVRLARFLEIPEPRRAHLSRVKAAVLGYV